MVDFESLRANGKEVGKIFLSQQWKNYFDLLNGLVYYNLIKEFWVKAYVYDESRAKNEMTVLLNKNPQIERSYKRSIGSGTFQRHIN
jgi:hypothetical protein